MIDGTIPYASHGITYGSDKMEAAKKEAALKQRMDGFNLAAAEADFVWCFLERTAASYRDRFKACEFMPVGYIGDTVPPSRRRSPKDIDAFFFGKMTPHRMRVLDTLAARKIAPIIAGEFTGLGWVPDFLADSLLDRAKVGINLTLHDEASSPGVSDPRFASCMRIVEMLRRDTFILSEDIPLDNPYRPYMRNVPVAELAEECRRVLDSEAWRAEGEAAGARFRTEMAVQKICAPVIDRTLAGLGVT